MKTTKIFTIAVLALMLSACSSNDIEENLPQPKNQAEGIPFSATISIGEGATTRALTESGSAIVPSWVAGEEVALIHNDVIDVVEVQSVSNGLATLTGTLTGSPANDDHVTIIYPSSAADGTTGNVKAALLAAQDGTLATIAEKYDVRKGAGTLNVGATATLYGNVSLTNQFAIVKFSLTDGTNALAATQFVIKDGSNNVLTTVTPSPAASSTLYVAMAPATASAFKFEASDANYTYTYTKASATLAAGTYYQSSITLSNIKFNPLWWMAQYNMAEGGSSFVTSHSTESQYCFDFTDACAEAVANYHLPTCAELTSILPCNKAPLTSDNIFKLTETLNNPKEFSEITCTVGGSSVSANTSVIGKNADADYYAVRFIGTQYASAWHYKWITSPCTGLLIESYLIPGGCADIAAAKMILAGLASSTIFTGSANSSSANQTPETTAVTANAFVQRFLPACGAIYGSGGSGIASSGIGIVGNYSSATEGYDSTTNWNCYFNKNGDNYYFRGLSVERSYGNSVRLFRDN